MSLPYRDTTLKSTLDGSDHVVHHILDGAPTLESALTTVISGLTAMQTAIVTSQDLSAVDIIAALQSILTAQGVPANGPKMGYVGSIGAATNSQFGTQVLSRGMAVKNITGGDITLYMSHLTGQGATGHVVYIRQNEWSPFFGVADANAVYFNAASGSTGAACYLGC